jgi:hypothetical protein
LSVAVQDLDMPLTGTEEATVVRKLLAENPVQRADGEENLTLIAGWNRFRQSCVKPMAVTASHADY